MSCIYKITNLQNNKIYIGQTVKSPMARFNAHWWDAVRFMKREQDGKANDHESRLYRALVKYGKNNFKVEAIHDVLADEDINELETYYIKLYKATDPEIGYNIAEGGNKPPSRINRHQTVETKQKQSQVQLGKHWYTDGKIELMVLKNECPPEGFHLGRLSNQGFKSGKDNPSFGKPGYNTGKNLTAETKARISLTKKANNKNKQMVWYNNGVTEIQIDLNKEDNVIPTGYVRGRLRTNLRPVVSIEVYDIMTGLTTTYQGFCAVTNATGLAFTTINKSIVNKAVVKNRYICQIKTTE